MQNSVPKGEGGMLAVLGVKVEDIEKILKDNEKKFNAQIANDNSDGQIVLSGKNKDLESISNFLKDHRVFMTSVVAALTFGGNWKISDKDSIKTSFPSFISKIKNLGAKLN